MKRLGPHILLACTPTVIVISVVAGLGLAFLFPEPGSRWIVVGVPLVLATAMWVGFWLTYRPISVDIDRGILWFTGVEHPLADVQSANVSTWGNYTILRLETTRAGVSALIAGGPVFPLSAQSRALLAEALERSGIVDPPASVRVPNVGFHGARHGFTWRSVPVSLSRSDAVYFLTGAITNDPPRRAIEVVRTGRTVARRIIWVASAVLAVVALFLGMLALLTM
ncbi:MAG: hypothetical protein ACOH19_09015 [Rhodoglobus sp.]